MLDTRGVHEATNFAPHSVGHGSADRAIPMETVDVRTNTGWLDETATSESHGLR